MRNFTRALAIFLLALMLVGMIPFSLFAEEGTDTPADDTTGKTYAEQIADYVAKNNGVIYFAHDYNEGVNSGEALTGSSRINSLVGGKISLTFAPKSGTITVEDGALKFVKTTDDSFAQANFSQKDTAGKDMVIELSVKGENIPNGANVVFTQEYLNKVGGGDEMCAYRLITTQDGNYITNFGKKPLAAVSEEYVNFKVVVKYSLNVAYFFVDDQYVCMDKLVDGTYDYSRSKSGFDVAAPSLIRFGHYTGNGSAMYIDNTYVYAASVPYGCTMPETNSYLATTLADFLSAKGQRLLNGLDFETDTTIISSNGVVYPNVAGTHLIDQSYAADATKLGFTYNFYNPFMRNGGGLVLRASNLYITEVNGNNALAIEQAYPYNGHTYMDVSLNGHHAGESFVASLDVKRFDNTNYNHTLISFRWNDMGKGESGTATDGSGKTATYAGAGNKDLGGVGYDAQGRLYMTDYTDPKGTRVYIGQMTSTEFNNVAVVYHVEDNTADAYYNGRKVATIGKVIGDLPTTFTVDGVEYAFDDYTYADCVYGMGRINLGVSSTAYQVGGHYLDNIAIYTGTELETAAEDTTALQGWVQENGYWRYYENGVPALGEKEIDGVKYYFEKEGAYVSEKVRYSLVDLYKTYTSVQGDSMVNGLAANTQLGPSMLVTGSGKYTYLWKDIYKNSNSAAGNNNVKLELGATYTANSATGTVYYNSMFITNRNTLLNDGNIENDWIGRLMRDGVDYANLNSYYAIEYVAYSELANTIGTYIILGQDNWGSNIPGYTSKWGFSSGMCGRQIKVEFTEGWNTYTHFLDAGFEFGDHETSLGHNRNGGFERIRYISFQPGWSSTNTKYENYDKAEIYFDNFYVVDYVPVKDVPAAGFRTTAEGTYYYENAYQYATGWKNIDGGDYYFYEYNGLMAVGNAVVDGVGMTFDDNGKLLDATATGWFTVNGIECIYIDGVLQTGAFEYGDKSYYASFKGEIFSDIGEIGYTFDKEYVPTYLTSITDVMLAVDFNNQTAGSKVGGYGKVSVGSRSISFGGSSVDLRPKLTYFQYVDEGNGNIALEVNNEAARVDSYVNFGIGSIVSKNEETDKYTINYKDSAGEATIPGYVDGKLRNMVFEFDVKLDENWAADALIFQPIGYRMDTGVRANVAGAVARVNEQGYIYVGNDKTKVVCKLSTDSYTNLAFVVHQADKTADIYVNGVLMVTGIVYLNADYDYALTEGRTFQYPGDARGTARIDNIAFYLAEQPASYDGVSVASKNGWLTEGGVQRYYENGLMRTSALQIPDENGVLTYYYFNAKNGMCEGVANGWLDGKYYVDGVAVYSTWIEDGKYYVQADGTCAKGYVVIDGVPYYFNTATGELEKGGAIEDTKVVITIDDILGNLGTATPNYSVLVDGLNYTAKMKDAKKLYNVNGMDAMDLTGYDYAAFDIWVGGEYIGDYKFLLGFTETFYHLAPIYKETEVTDPETGAVTVNKEIAGYSYNADGEAFFVNDRDEENYKWVNTNTSVKVGGNSYVLWTATAKDGTVEYYGRVWDYQTTDLKLDNLKPGWNTVYVSLDRYSKYLSATTQIGITTTGWSLNNNNQGWKDNWTTYEIIVGEVRVVKLAKAGTEIKTGWIEYDGNTYYVGEYGEMFTGYKMIDGVMYQFTETGALIGKANGKVALTLGYYEYNEEYDKNVWITYDAERIYVDGVMQTGKVTYTDGNSYFCDAENGAILKDTQVLFESYVYNCGADGVITPAARVWFTDTDGSVYYTTATGKVTANTSTKIDGFFYGFDATGKMIVDAYVKVGATGNNYRYCGPDGKCVTGIYDKVVYGYNEDGTPIYKTAYFNPTSGLKTVPTDGMIEGVEYVFDEEGYILYVAHDHAYDNDCDADCNVCGEVRATEHVYDNACDADCNVCGATREVAHDYDVVVIEPTCTTGGSTTYTCKGCGTSYVEDVTDATGHTEVIVPAVDATCTTDGYSEGTVCSVCATVIVEQIKIAAQGHVYDDDADATCNVCGEEREIVEPEVIIAQGACGASVNWKLLEDGTLVIYGNGGMEDCFEVKAQPYYNYLKQITKVVVKEGVTFIGRNAFYGYTAITEVVLPESLMAIEEYAFYGCSGLTEFDVPAKVFYIGKYAFRRSNITTFNFADQNGWAFVDGTVLDHSSARPLTKDATYMLACMKTVEGAGNVIVTGTFGSKDQFTWTLSDTGVLNVTGKGDMPKFNVNTTPWYGYRGAIRTVVIGEGVTSIGRCSFHTCRAIVSVTLPETIETIAQYGFYNMPYITEISIPASVTRIEGFALRKCVSLTSIEMGIYYGWTVGGTKLAAVELYNTTVDAFLKTYYNDVWERDVNAPFEDVNDPYFVAAGACNSYTNWKLVYVDEAKTQMKLTISGNGIMPTYGTGGAPWYEYAASIVEIEVTEGVTNVGRCAFYNLRYVTKVTLANTITSIDAYAFNGCKGLTEIVIPESVTNIDPTAFGKTGLTTIPTV